MTRRQRSAAGSLLSLALIVMMGATAGAALVTTMQGRSLEQLLGGHAPSTPAPDAVQPDMRAAARLAHSNEPSRTIYLNREGALLRGGPDDATLNVSSVVANSPLDQVRVPAFAGSPGRWSAIARCIREKFASYNVQIVEQRPVDADYLMVMLGGTPDDLGFRKKDKHAHSHSTGLAPFNGHNIPRAVVFVFTRELKESVKETCEAAAMEIAHAYGLDHARHCKDLMTYLRPCGARVFLDRDIPCGEHEDRPCQGGGLVQNGHRRLLELLGPRT